MQIYFESGDKLCQLYFRELLRLQPYHIVLKKPHASYQVRDHSEKHFRRQSKAENIYPQVQKSNTEIILVVKNKVKRNKAGTRVGIVKLIWWMKIFCKCGNNS